MSQPTAYEQLIAQKLQELEVPDQASSIWATIEHHLNIEMPVQGPGSGGGSGNPGWWLGGGGGSLLTLVVATVTYLVVSKQKVERERHLNETPASIEYKKPITKQDTSGRSVPLPKINTPAKPADNLVQEPLAPTADTVRVAPAPKEVAEAPVQPVAKDTLPVAKKPRGVRGLTDSDYRIVPDKKDSTRRRN